MPEPSAERAAGALRNLMAPRAGLLRTQSTKDQINPGLSLWLDEKRGSGHRRGRRRHPDRRGARRWVRGVHAAGAGRMVGCFSEVWLSLATRGPRRVLNSSDHVEADRSEASFGRRAGAIGSLAGQHQPFTPDHSRGSELTPQTPLRVRHVAVSPVGIRRSEKTLVNSSRTILSSRLARCIPRQ